MTERRTDLLILGAQKAATTTLFDLLARSEQIVAAYTKEPHFFSTRPDWRERIAQYHRLYGEREGIRCEASTSYTFFPHRRLEIWRDIREYNPQMKAIYIVRNPLDRILSHYRHSIRRRYTKDDIRDFALNYPLPLAISRYCTQITPFIDTFGRENVCLLDFDDLVKRQQDVLDDVARFVGIDRIVVDRSGGVHSNSSGSLRHHRLQRLGPLGRVIDSIFDQRRNLKAEAAEIPQELKRAILHELELEIQGIERLMDRDFSSWRAI